MWTRDCTKPILQSKTRREQGQAVVTPVTDRGTASSVVGHARDQGGIASFSRRHVHDGGRDGHCVPISPSPRPWPGAWGAALSSSRPWPRRAVHLRLVTPVTEGMMGTVCPSPPHHGRDRGSEEAWSFASRPWAASLGWSRPWWPSLCATIFIFQNLIRSSPISLYPCTTRFPRMYIIIPKLNKIRRKLNNELNNSKC